jgi:hypothetical protein
MDWGTPEMYGDYDGESFGSEDVATASVLYIGLSLFADLVDAKREFGWTTAAVTPEVGNASSPPIAHCITINYQP